jgi:hypothetical protein
LLPFSLLLAVAADFAGEDLFSSWSDVAVLFSPSFWHFVGVDDDGAMESRVELAVEPRGSDR